MNNPIEKSNTKSENLVLKQCRRIGLFSFLLFLSGCTVSLAPKFDQNIVDNLTDSSTEIFQLLAGVSEGTSKDDYAKRDEKYNQMIGQFEALELQINARPMPQNRTIDKIISKANASLAKRNGTPIVSVGEIAPSATALKNVIANIEKMKETDNAQGIKKLEVQVFKNNIELYLDQALTYELFLNRQ